MSGNAGSLVAWFDCRPGTPGTLVVFDTSLGRGVFHQRMSACAQEVGNTPSCRLTAVVGEHVRLPPRPRPRWERPGQWSCSTSRPDARAP